MQRWHRAVVRLKGGALGTVAGERHQELTKHLGEKDENEMRMMGKHCGQEKKLAPSSQRWVRSSKEMYRELWEERKQNNKQYLALRIRVETTNLEAVFT